MIYYKKNNGSCELAPIEESAPTPAPTQAPTQAPTPAPTQAEKPLNTFGDNPSGNNLPLKECEGDCDKDSDCFGDLKCFQRNEYDKVPGCSGTGTKGSDYCYDPNKFNDVYPPQTTLKHTGNGRGGTNSRPLNECEGDCDKDSDCFGDLKCFQRNEYDKVPGCSGTGTKGTDYCYDPNKFNDVYPPQTTLKHTGNGRGGTNSRPLNKCEGDCDKDSDCFGDLKCFQRNGNEKVPGCSGTGTKGWDYCYDPTQAPTQAPTEAPTQAPTPAPTQAPTEAPTQAPTQAPTEAPTQEPTDEPTQEPTDEPTQKPKPFDPSEKNNFARIDKYGCAVELGYKWCESLKNVLVQTAMSVNYL